MKRKPKFKVGQVVMYEDSRKVFDGPVKIKNISWHLKGQDGKENWLYGDQGRKCWESALRPLTARERGIR